MAYTVKQARKLNDLTQEQMAQMMGVNRDTYRRIERRPDKATVWQAHQISKITGIPMDNLIFLPETQL